MSTPVSTGGPDQVPSGLTALAQASPRDVALRTAIEV